VFKWNEKSLLKRKLQDLQSDLEKEQGKCSRLAGFISRLQAFGVSPTGIAPRRAFGEALMDTVHVLLKVEQAALLETDPHTLDLAPVATLGFAPQMLPKLRVMAGEKFNESLLTAPAMIVPLTSQGQAIGLLVIGKSVGGPFSAEDRRTMSLLAAQAALILEDYQGYEKLAREREETVAALSRAVEARDPVTHRHADRTRALVRAFTQEMSLPEILIQQIEDGAMLHDVGKIGIADSILKKTSELTPEEYDVMKTHSTLGRTILESIPSFRAVSPIVLYHQEWFNGSGYPDGLAAEEIPLGARIVQVIDAWDAMTSNRPYRKAMSKAAAMAELRRNAGTQFDPKLVDLFLRVIDRLEREGVATTEVAGGPLLAAPRA
jgi:hypothetical protein